MKSNIKTDKEGFRLPFAEVEVYDTLDSTNTVARERVFEGCEEWHTVVALSQTGGQGRLGRSFYSPGGTGLYMSCVLYPDEKKAPLLTGAAAVAVCEALEAYGLSPSVKWVNDVYIGGRKVCGILAKGVTAKGVSAVILGIGINVYAPEEGFPEDIADSAGYLFDAVREGQTEALFVSIMNALRKRIEGAGADDAPEEYRKRCITVGKEVTVIPAGRPECARRAVALGIDDSYHISVRYDNGEEETLLSGEVSVKI